MDIDTNGCLCRNCGALFPVLDVREHEVRVLEDSMYGRPPTLETKLEALCPHCDSDNIVPVVLCERCLKARPMLGSDYCPGCDVIAELEEFHEQRRRSREERHRELLTTLVDIARSAL